MYVNPAEAAAVQLLALDQLQYLFVPRGCCRWQRRQELQDLRAPAQRPAGQLPDHERVHEYEPVLEQRAEARLAAAQVLDPDGCVGERQAEKRRRGIGRSFCSVPPSAASRRALSSAMSASSPLLTNAVFSRSPVSSAARLSNSSSMISVVLICMNMHQTYA
jgi:hypothetical protein